MKLIKKYINETEIQEIRVDDFALFYQNSVGDLKSGYRFYCDTPCGANDITLDHVLLSAADELTMYRPAEGVSAIIGAIVGSIIVGAVAVKLLTPKIEAPANANRQQSSSTNSFGQRENTIRLGERVDDIYGKVAGFTPSLIQSPHYRYENNTQIEHFAFAYYGRCLEENHKDGQTPFERIPNAKYNSWIPGSDLSGAPFVNIGGDIDRPINSISISEELQSQELLPPNDLDITGSLDWRVTSSTNTATITLSNYEDLEVDLRDYYSIGGEALLLECVAIVATQQVTLYSSNETSYDFTDITSQEFLDGQYEVINVTESSIVIDTSDVSWQTFSDAPLVSTYYETTSNIANRSIIEPSINDIQYYETLTQPGVDDPVTVIGDVSYSPIVGPAFNEAVGPVAVRENTDVITINLVAQNGFYNIYKGNEQRLEVNIRIEHQELDADGNLTGNSITTNVEFASNGDSITKQAAKTVDLPNPYEYSQLILRRTTDRNKGQDYSNIDKVNWEDLYFEEFVEYPENADLTVGQAQIPSSATARSIKQRLINFDATRYIEPYLGDGSFGASQPVSTWAESLIACSLNKVNGRLQLDNIDADTILLVQQQMLEYYGTSDAIQFGYDLDSTKIRFQEIYSLFCNAVNVKAYSQGGVFKAYPDIERTTSSKQFTHRNKIPNTDSKTRSYEVEYDGVELTYRSNDSGKFETVVKHVNGVESFNRYTIELSGAVTEAQATIRANRELNLIKYQKYNYSFDADSIARLTVLGERVDNVDYSRIVKRDNNMNSYQIYSGYVVEVKSDPTLIELSEDVYFTAGENHSIRFTARNGDLLDVISVTQYNDSKRIVRLASLPSESIYDGYRQEKTSYTLAADSQRDSLPCIIRSSKAKNAQGLKARTLTAINFDSRYYQDDKYFSEV